MLKQAAFILMITGLVSCGGNTPGGKLPGSTSRSQVSPLFKPTSLNESHGDGRHAIFTIKVPLSESSLSSVDSPIDPRGGVSRVPLFGDVLRLVGQATMNFATRFGVADQKLVISQPIPEIDLEIVKHVSIKRVFLQIEQTKNLEDRGRRSWWDSFRSFIRGGDDLDFDFIDDLKLKMRMATTPGEIIDFVPTTIFQDDTPELYDAEMRIARADQEAPVEIIDYRKKNRTKLVHNLALGEILVVYTDFPVEMQQFIRRHDEFKDVIKDVTKIGKSLIVELKGRELETQKFFHLLDLYESEVAGLAIKKIDRCFDEKKHKKRTVEDDVCMDVKVDQRNLLPMLMKGNTLKIDTEMNLDKIPPKSFQLRGYIEFELKINSPL